MVLRRSVGVESGPVDRCFLDGGTIGDGTLGRASLCAVAGLPHFAAVASLLVRSASWTSKFGK